MEQIPKNIKIEALKERRKEQEEKSEVIEAKISGVKGVKKELIQKDQEALQASDNFQRARSFEERSEEAVQKLLEDELIGPLLKKKGILSPEDYIKLTAEEKAEIDGLTNRAFETHQKAAVDLALLRGELRGAVKERGEAKDELLEKIQEEKPENKGRTFKSLTVESGRVVEDIQKAEIDAVVSELLVKGKQAMKNWFDKSFVEKYGYPELITENDIINTGNLGRKYEWAVKNLYYKKMEELIPKVAEEIFQQNPNKFTSLQSLIDSMQTKLSHSKQTAERAVSGMEQTIVKENNTEKLEKITPEVESVFADLSNVISSSPYGHLVKSFAVHNEDVIIFNFEVIDDKESAPGKFFNWTYGNNRSGEMWSDKITENLSNLVEEKKKVEESQGVFQNRKNKFNQKNIFSKFMNGDERKRIDRGIRQKGEELRALNNIETLLGAMNDFVLRLKKLKVDNNLFVKVDNNKKFFELNNLKEAYTKGLKEGLSL